MPIRPPGYVITTKEELADMYTIRQAADELSMTENAVRKAIRSGKLSAYSASFGTNGRKHIPKAEVEKFKTGLRKTKKGTEDVQKSEPDPRDYNLKIVKAWVVDGDKEVVAARFGLTVPQLIDILNKALEDTWYGDQISGF